MDVRNGTAEPLEGYPRAPLGAPDSPDAAADSPYAGGLGVVRLCEDCGRDTYDLTRSRCTPCRTEGTRDEASGDELWPLVELDVGEG